ncbi:MAG: toxin HipA [Nitrosomonadales bacterium SCN 54-20]|nr:MAG: toxin HipA [Nitrosomonadales bacterium SCN 54-20]
MTHELEVWLFANRVGTLTLITGRLMFQYAAEWLVRTDAVPLSHSLPLRAESFDDHAARPFFAGLLPEGRLRRMIARQFHVSAQNDFALLDHIGGECAGAVTFLEPGQPLLQQSSGDDVEWLNDRDIVAILEELPRRPMLAGKDGLRLSLAGAQDKLPVTVDGNRIGLPRNGTASTHILKPLISALEDSVTNEGFCLALAEVVRLRAARSQIRSLGGLRFLLVERYDRLVNPQGYIQRLHQEDFCQALGVVPEMKYQSEGGPGLAQCFDLVRRAPRPSAPQVLRLFDYVVFNTLIGNHDAHAKNFSLLYTDKKPVLAPLYDTLSTAVYPNLTPKMAMKLGSKYKFSEVQARHWDQFAEAAGLAKAQARKRILELARTLPKAARQLQSAPDSGFSSRPQVESIIRVIEQRSTLTMRQLTDPTGND